MNHQARKIHGRNLNAHSKKKKKNAHYKVKEADLKRLHTVMMKVPTSDCALRLRQWVWYGVRRAH